MRTILHAPVLTVIVNDFNFGRARIGPPETDAVPLVNSNAMLSSPIAPQRLKAIPRWHHQVI
jgi:hypothetical protein